MSYSTISHESSYPPPPGFEQGYGPAPPRSGFEEGYGYGPGYGSGPAPPPPPRPGFEQGYGHGPAYGPGYQGYFNDSYPQVSHVHHSGPTHFPFQHQSYDYSYDNGCSSFFRTCLTALCCCCILEQCCTFW